jgi:DNA-directed RNA polymerase subunit RPC12/RpoP
MKLKLDLHPIYNDSRAIDAALKGIMDEATAKRSTEVEVIPGKGSGQLKKAVLRFLDQPEVKARYHRIEKDGDNWGRLFIHFRWERLQEPKAVARPRETADYACFCCGTAVTVPVSAETLRENGPETRQAECPSCGSPNSLTVQLDPRGTVQIDAISGYE